MDHTDTAVPAGWRGRAAAKAGQCRIRLVGIKPSAPRAYGRAQGSVGGCLPEVHREGVRLHEASDLPPALLTELATCSPLRR
jgi:hypothetical protein